MVMKKIYGIIVLIFILSTVLISCKSIKATQTDKVVENTTQENTSEVVDSNNKQEQSKPKESNVTINGDLVTIKLPKEYQYEGEVGELTSEKIQSGFIESKLNDDESISYTMNKKDYDSYVSEFKEGIIFRFKTIQKSTTYKTIKKFDFNSELTKAVFWVDKDKYYGSGEEIAAKNVAREMAYYQIFSGVFEDDVDVEVKILDNNDDKILEKIIY